MFVVVVSSKVQHKMQKGPMYNQVYLFAQERNKKLPFYVMSLSRQKSINARHYAHNYITIHGSKNGVKIPSEIAFDIFISV